MPDASVSEIGSRDGSDADPDHAFLLDDAALEPGEAVVHFEHGLARFDGLEELEVDGAKQTLVRLSFRDDDHLLVPERELDIIWRYGAPAEEVRLDALRTEHWMDARNALIEELKEVAHELADEYERRRGRDAPHIAPPAKKMDAFAADFPHELTGDQERAVAKVLADMSGPPPMDRILVGDVGFGKTEVALRAAAAVAFAGRQVVVAAPTTVLARQHFDTFRERMEPHGIKVRELTGDADDADETVAALHSGACDVVVGTHALVSHDLRFDDLGLVVVDEEQRFGADVKRALRALNGQAGVHMLLMTATPIPSTMAAAQVGLCEVSVMMDAPKDRLPVETKLVEGGGRKAMLDAIEKELARGGQAYVVSPRISGIEDDGGVAEMLEGLDARVEVAHGQQDAEETAAAMRRFMGGEADVLLATTLIEAGLDNPRANTMVVWNCDRFGLSQLHQLRGRIGRAKEQAYMTLLAPDEMSDTARKRLDTFVATSELGAGFAVARRDAEMRGHGDVAGEEQSGRTSRLGLGLTRHVLVETLRERLDRPRQAA